VIGQVIGNYRIVSELGKGGMGMVYRAEHVQLGRPAALKMLLPQYSSNPSIVQRFFNEARAASAIDHPGIVEVFDFGTHTDGAAYIVMALLKGESLEQRIKRARVSPMDAAAIIAQVLGALAAAHARGIAHRDLKPDNIFLVPNELMPGNTQIKLLDFGIAKLSGDGAGGSQTQTGVMMGTPAYMSPEQCMGKSDLDHRTDLYSIGCILYQLLTGRPPFTGEQGTGMMIAAHIRDVPADPRTLNPEIPDRLAAIVMRLLEKDPAARFQSALETRDALAAIGVSPASRPPLAADPAFGYAATLAPIPGTAGQTTASGSAAQLVPVHTVTPTKRGGGMFVLLGILLAGLGGVGWWVALRGSDPQKPASLVASAPSALKSAMQTPQEAAQAAPPAAATGSGEAVRSENASAPSPRAPQTPSSVQPSEPSPTAPEKGALDPRLEGLPSAALSTLSRSGQPAPTRPSVPPPPPPNDPSRPKPGGAVPKLELRSKTYPTGGTITVTFAAPMPSPGNNRAWVTVVAAGARPDQYDRWTYVENGATTAILPVPSAPGAYEVRLHTDYPQRSTNLRQSVPITVKDATGGSSVEHRFMLATKIARVGALVDVTFPGPMKAAAGEKFWITTIEKGAPDSKYGQWAYVEDGAREMSIPMPTTPGSYEIRLHANYPRLSTNVVHRASIRVED
jgi:eukaryotic-like serine/threonine-protein kinase